MPKDVERAVAGSRHETSVHRCGESCGGMLYPCKWPLLRLRPRPEILIERRGSTLLLSPVVRYDGGVAGGCGSGVGADRRRSVGGRVGSATRSAEREDLSQLVQRGLRRRRGR